MGKDLKIKCECGFCEGILTLGDFEDGMVFITANNEEIVISKNNIKKIVEYLKKFL